MTLEMGKPVKESAGRDLLRGRVPSLVLRAGGPHRRPFRGGAERAGPAADDEAAVGPCLLITPWNSRWRWGPGDRAGDRGRLHDGGQAGAAHTALDADARQDPGGGGLPPGVLNVITASSSSRTMATADRGPAAAQLSFTARPSRAEVDGAGFEERAAAVDGIGRQRAVPRVRGRRYRRGRGGRGDRKDAQHRRACTRPTASTSRNRFASKFAEGLAERLGAMKVGPRHQPDVDVGPLIDASNAARSPSSSTTPSGAARACWSAAASARAPATSTTRPCSPTCLMTHPAREEIFGRSRPSRASRARRGDQGRNNTEFASWRTSTPAI